MSRLVILVGLAMALALALPDSAQASSLREVRKLTASDAQIRDNFGLSSALSGDTAIVGAFREDANGENAGAAYVYQRDHGGAGNWGEVAKLASSDAQAGDFFGFSVALSGDTAVVGAVHEGPGGGKRGAAYVFMRDQGGAAWYARLRWLT